jgi:hypothetical protein
MQFAAQIAANDDLVLTFRDGTRSLAFRLSGEQHFNRSENLSANVREGGLLSERLLAARVLVEDALSNLIIAKSSGVVQMTKQVLYAANAFAISLDHERPLA